jgi:RNA polymerase sigma-70 factor, ECF subfamily
VIEPTDIELMLQVREGDSAAFHRLVARYREPLRRFFRSILEDRSQADDFVQETLLRLWFSRERYEPTGRFSTYLFQIGKHYWLNQRKKFHIVTADTDESAQQVADTSPHAQPETAVLEQERRRRVRQAIEALPDHYRSVFVLSHLEGLRYAEIAERLSIPIGTVKSRMSEAVRRLRQMLIEEEKP